MSQAKQTTRSLDQVAAEIADTRYDLGIRDIDGANVAPNHRIKDVFRDEESAEASIKMIILAYLATTQL